MKEINTNIENLKIIEPFTLKYITMNLIEPFILKFKLNNKFYLPDNTKYYEESYYTMPISKYINILEKIFNNENKNICYSCKKNNANNFFCNLCHEWVCSSCKELHLQEIPEHEKNIKDFNINIIYSCYIDNDKEIEKLINKLFKIKFLNEDNLQKKWNICECENGGGEVICYCKHGLKCKNCIFEKDQICINCDATSFKESRYFYLDIIFLEAEINKYDYLTQINNDIDNFNNYIAKLFIENINNIKENKSRKKRFKKHFNDLRKNFITYQKLKLLVINQLKQDKNYHLIQLFKKMKNLNLCFKEFKFNEKLTLEENISKISNFFATQKPIYFSDHIREKNMKNVVEEQTILDKTEVKMIDAKKKIIIKINLFFQKLF